MKNLLAASLLTGLSFAVPFATRAQTSGPAFPAIGQGSSEANARRNNAEDPARNQRRATMSPDEAKRDQQLEMLEARTGNTSFDGRNSSPERQFETKHSGTAFLVRKFKPQAGKAGYAEQKRGMSHPVGGANPAGKPLVHNHSRKKRFLLF